MSPRLADDARTLGPGFRGRSRRLWYSARRVAGIIVATSVFAVCCESQNSRLDTCLVICAGAACSDAKECDRDEECAIGTRCVLDECRPPDLPDFQHDALLRGFATDEIVLTRGESSTFHVAVPKAAQYMLCALFVGPPRFDERALVNASSCIARFREFPLNSTSRSESLVLRLDDLRTLPTDSCGSSALNTGSENFRVVETLHLGCWSMSRDGISAASLLLTLDPMELPEWGADEVDCQQSDIPTDGSVCTLEPITGACKDQVCVSKVKLGRPPDDGLQEVCMDLAEGDPCPIRRKKTGRCYGGSCVDQALAPSLVVADCSGTNWSNCFPSFAGTVGTCFDESCRVRCHDDIDCTSAAPASEAFCRRPKRPSYLGVCVGEESL